MARLRNTEKVMTINGLRAMRHETGVTSQKTERELGVSFRPLAETLADEIDWFAQKGYLKRQVNVRCTAVASPAYKIDANSQGIVRKG